MALSKCDICGKLFNSYGTKVCRSCSEAVEAGYVKVRNFMYQNPDKKRFSIIVEETGVTEKLLNNLIDSGRIVIEDRKKGGIRCMACGAITSGGQLCDKCKAKLISEKLITKSYVPEDETNTFRVKPLSSNINNNNE
jgi:predicted amidophosphoribosyltransferase